MSSVTKHSTVVRRSQDSVGGLGLIEGCVEGTGDGATDGDADGAAEGLADGEALAITLGEPDTATLGELLAVVVLKINSEVSSQVELPIVLDPLAVRVLLYKESAQQSVVEVSVIVTTSAAARTPSSGRFGKRLVPAMEVLSSDTFKATAPMFSMV